MVGQRPTNLLNVDGICLDLQIQQLKWFEKEEKKTNKQVRKG